MKKNNIHFLNQLKEKFVIELIVEDKIPIEGDFQNDKKLGEGFL